MNEIAKRRNAIMAIGAFVIVAIITISVIASFKKEMVEPVSSEAPSYLKDVDLAVVEKKIQSALEISYGISKDDQENVKVVVRENTFKYIGDSENESFYASFLVDVSEPKLTYIVGYSFETKEASLSCPSIELMQDTNVFCIGDDDSTIDVMLSRYLPYDGTTESGVEFTIWEDYDIDGLVRLNMYADICDDEEVGREVEQAIKSWIKEKGVSNPDIIPLNLHYSYCNYHRHE